MTMMTTFTFAQTEIGTSGLQQWLINNAIPLLLLAVAVLLLWLGGSKGDNAGVMRRVGGIVIALAIVGLAIQPAAGVSIGEWLSSLFTS